MILIAERLVAAAPAEELAPTVLDWLRGPTDPEAKPTIVDCAPAEAVRSSKNAAWASTDVGLRQQVTAMPNADQS